MAYSGSFNFDVYTLVCTYFKRDEVMKSLILGLQLHSCTRDFMAVAQYISPALSFFYFHKVYFIVSLERLTYFTVCKLRVIRQKQRT